FVADAGEEAAESARGGRSLAAVDRPQEGQRVFAEVAGVGRLQGVLGEVAVGGDAERGAVRPAAVDRVLVGAGALGDPFHGQARVAGFGEFGRRRAQDRL